MRMISVQIPEDDAETLKQVAVLVGKDKSSVIRTALREGLTERRLRKAIEQYQSGEVSTNQAARMAGVSIADWLEIARERNLTTQLSPDDLDAEVETAREL